MHVGKESKDKLLHHLGISHVRLQPVVLAPDTSTVISEIKRKQS